MNQCVAFSFSCRRDCSSFGNDSHSCNCLTVSALRAVSSCGKSSGGIEETGFTVSNVLLSLTVVKRNHIHPEIGKLNLGLMPRLQSRDGISLKFTAFR